MDRKTVFDDPLEGWKNGLSYLRPCLNSHKPVDIVILMLGSNDLKETFHASAEQIADGAATLVKVIQTFTKEKQGSPPQIGGGIRLSPFYGAFSEDAIVRSREFPKWYRKAAEEHNCIFFDAAKHIQASKVDSLHLGPEAHAKLAEELSKVVGAL